MPFWRIITNQVLIAGVISWLLAQSLKVPIDRIRNHRTNWSLLFSAGGMPSSHTSLVTSTALAIGLYTGFDTPLFALAAAVAMIVIYDATGIRRQAGIHAHTINLMMEELFKGNPINEKQLKEVLGHTPGEALGGFVLGIIVALLVWAVWR